MLRHELVVVDASVAGHEQLIAGLRGVDDPTLRIDVRIIDPGADGIEALRRRFAALSPDFERCVMGFVGGEVWTRPGLDLKTRSLCSIAALAAGGRTNALKLNVRMALNNGASRQEIVEAFFQVAVYAGFAAAWDGLEKAGEVFAEIDADASGHVEGDEEAGE